MDRVLIEKVGELESGNCLVQYYVVRVGSDRVVIAHAVDAQGMPVRDAPNTCAEALSRVLAVSGHEVMAMIRSTGPVEWTVESDSIVAGHRVALAVAIVAKQLAWRDEDEIRVLVNDGGYLVRTCFRGADWYADIRSDT